MKGNPYAQLQRAVLVHTTMTAPDTSLPFAFAHVTVALGGNGRELLVVGNAGSFGVTEDTHRQIGERLGIPRAPTTTVCASYPDLASGSRSPKPPE
jgi:hypothetical protein